MRKAVLNAWRAPLPLYREEAWAGEEKAGVLIGDGQRVAIERVTGLEVPLEVGGPEVIGGGGVRWDHAGMVRGPSAATPLHEAAAREKVPDRARGRSPQVRVPWPQPVEQFAGPPETAYDLDVERDRLGSRLVREVTVRKRQVERALTSAWTRRGATAGLCRAGTA